MTNVLAFGIHSICDVAYYHVGWFLLLREFNSFNEISLSFFAGQNVQVVQFPAMQQTVPVQVPISTGNGQTIYQTVHVPLQALAGQMPGLVQPQMQIFQPQMQVRRIV